jgi:tetratricopeptide (TPR) repeat protein
MCTERKAGTIFIMRRLLLPAVAALLGSLAACAPKVVPAPIVTAPKFPEFSQPPVPLLLAASPAIAGFERGWRFLQAGDLRNAEREMAAALSVAPAFHPAEAALGYLNLARKDPKPALAHFDRALELQGDYISALIGRGQTLVVLERESEAIAAFGAALAVDPSRSELQRRIEVLRFRGLERDLAAARAAARSERPDEARRAYQAAIASSPDSAFLYRELGAVERQAGAADAALGYFRKAVELDPSDASSLAQIGELLEARGDQQGSLAAYARSLQLEPNDAVESRRDALLARLELAKLPAEYRAIDTAAEITRGDLAALIGVRLSALVQQMRAREPRVVVDALSHWAETWIMTVARAGIIEPFANHTLQPATLVRRADLAQAADRLLARIGTAAQVSAWQNARAQFTDIGAGHLAYPAASAAVAAGVMAAAADGSFQPLRLVTGAEAIETIQRLQTMAERAAGRASVGR